MQFEKWYNVDLLKPRQIIPDLGFPVFTGDNNSVRFGVNLFSDKQPIDASGTVTGYVILPNGMMVPPITGEKDGNKIWIDLPEIALELSGRIQLAIRLIDGEEETVISAASATVRRVDSDTIIDPDDVVPSWEDILTKIAQMDAAADACNDAAEAAEDAAEGALANFAPAFAEATANAAGSYVTYTDGKMYLLPNGHTANTTWANTTKSEVKVGGELTDLKSAINHGVLYEYNTYEQGAINTSGIDTPSTTYVRTPFIPFDNFDHISKPTGIQLFVFCYDSSKTYLTHQIYYNPVATITFKDITTLNANTKFVRFSASVIGSDATTPSDIVSSDLKMYLYTDEKTDELSAVVSKNNLTISGNVLDTTALLPETAITSSGGETANSSYATTGFIAVKQGDTVVATWGENLPITLTRIVTYTKNKTPIAGNVTAVDSYTIPNGVAFVRFCANNTYMTSPDARINLDGSRHSYEPYYAKPTNTVAQENRTDLVELNKIKIARSGNVLDTTELTPEHSITASGGLVENASYATTGFIAVNPGDVIVASFDRGLVMTISRIVTYNSNKTVINGSTTSVDSFTVPAGVSYVRFCANNTYLTDDYARINLNGTAQKFEPFYKGLVNDIASKNGSDISNILRYPLTTMRQDFVHTLAYKQLGVLSKGYVCFVSDDGNAAVATYTIPTFIIKEVPCTLAMMKESGVFNTTEGLDTVLDAVNNHGFCVAQHGGLYWTTYYDEYTLSKFFDEQLTYWESIGITPYGSCAPGHQVNDMIRAMCGGRFGCNRAAYFDGPPWYGDTKYINGPRSNMYSLTSQNIIEGDLDYWKDKCDMTKDNHWLMMIHMHEVELTSEAKTQLESVIDYAKSIGLTFITMKDIPTII